MQLTSTAFQNKAKIPARFTCDGENTSPELSWRDAPTGTKSFALFMHDPDAPRADGFTHWVLYNIPAGIAHLEPDVPKREQVFGTGTQGKNDSGKTGYMGPCPPSGTHRYFLRLYALDEVLKLPSSLTREGLERAMAGHILEQTELMGTYARAVQKAA
jgi:Raf kinase inhibitor-like YbhB/YbcL family protein